jgi:hypothetical protein
MAQISFKVHTYNIKETLVLRLTMSFHLVSQITYLATSLIYLSIYYWLMLTGLINTQAGKNPPHAFL